MPRRTLSPARVVDAAAALVDVEGLDALTLARLAARLGVRPPSLYNHVDGLDDLYAKLRLRAIDGLGDALAAACVGRSGADAVHALADAYRGYGREHPGLLALTVPESESADEAVRAAGRRIVEVVVRVLPAFGIEGEDALHATRALRAALHGFTVLEAAGGFGLAGVDVDESFDRLVAMLVAGLAPRAADGHDREGRTHAADGHR